MRQPAFNEKQRQIHNYCNVPYIVNPGYIGNAMSLPEFFYPNLDYSYASSHLSIPGEPVLRFQKNKLSYRFCDELAYA